MVDQKKHDQSRNLEEDKMKEVNGRGALKEALQNNNIVALLESKKKPR